MHRGAFCQIAFRWIYYYGTNKYTGKETGKRTSVQWYIKSLECPIIMDISRYLEDTGPLGLQLIEIPNCSNIVAYNSYYTGPNANWWHTAVILMKTL